MRPPLTFSSGGYGTVPAMIDPRRLLAALPLASTVFLLYAIVGAISLVAGSLEYGSYADNLLAIGVACGAIGLPRAIAKAAHGVRATGVLRWIETLPIPSIVFVLFTGVSAVSLALGFIEYGAFSDNVLKVGVACGAIGVPRVINKGALATIKNVPAKTKKPPEDGIGV